MPKRTSYILRWSGVQSAYILYETHSEPPFPTIVESGAWLSDIISFTFQGKNGTFTARKELRKHDYYWYAYRRIDGLLVKKYLGKAADMSVEQFERVAMMLASSSFDQQRAMVEPVSEPEKVVTIKHGQTSGPFFSTLLRFKISIPGLPTHVVPRSRVFAQLQRFSTSPLLLLSAPAGYGKTTTLCHWLTHISLLKAWVSLEEVDDEPIRFWSYVLGALDTCLPDHFITEITLLRSSQPPPLEDLLVRVLNILDQSRQALILVLDDYHVIHQSEIHSTMIFFLEHLPSHVHLVIATRNEPPFPLARLRMHAQLVTIGMADLRFSSNEIAAFIEPIIKSSLSSDDLDMLATRTEGWVAALQLFSFLLHDDMSSIADALATFTGGHRYILDFLVEEIIGKLPQEMYTFLLYTAILERFHAPLCAAVIGNIDTIQATKMLSHLEEANLFLVPLDNQRLWYRYHQLFADALRQVLQRTEPELIVTLHLRAAAWFEQHKYFTEAFQYLLVVHDDEKIAQFIEAHAQLMMKQGELAELQRWFDVLPPTLLHTRLRLCLLAGETLAFIGLLERAERCFQLVADLLNVSFPTEIKAETTPVISEDLASSYNELLVMRLMREAFAGKSHLTLEHLCQLQQRIPQKNIFLRGIVAMSLGIAYQTVQNWAAAYLAFEEAIRFDQEVGMHVLLISVTNLAYLLLMQGKLYQSRRKYEQALLLGKQCGGQISTLCMAHLGLGTLYYQWNDLIKAQKHLEMGITLVQHWNYAGMNTLLMAGLARIKTAQKEYEAASTILAQIIEFSQQQQVAFYIPYIHSYQVWLSLLQGDLVAVSNWLQESSLCIDNAENPLYQREYVILARIYMGTGRIDLALTLLERLLAGVNVEGEVMISILVLLACAYAAQQRHNQALLIVVRAVELAQPGGYIRVFLDEGAPLLKLLTSLSNPRSSLLSSSFEYLATLLTSFSSEGIACEQMPMVPSVDDPLIMPLSIRERDILDLLAAGYSNQEIANILHIAVSTVKAHTNTIYSKLHVERRTQAIMRARKLHLVRD